MVQSQEPPGWRLGPGPGSDPSGTELCRETWCWGTALDSPDGCAPVGRGQHPVRLLQPMPRAGSAPGPFSGQRWSSPCRDWSPSGQGAEEPPPPGPVPHGRRLGPVGTPAAGAQALGSGASLECSTFSPQSLKRNLIAGTEFLSKKSPAVLLFRAPSKWGGVSCNFQWGWTCGFSPRPPSRGAFGCTALCGSGPELPPGPSVWPACCSQHRRRVFVDAPAHPSCSPPRAALARSHGWDLTRGLSVWPAWPCGLAVASGPTPGGRQRSRRGHEVACL